MTRMKSAILLTIAILLILAIFPQTAVGQRPNPRNYRQVGDRGGIGIGVKVNTAIRELIFLIGNLKLGSFGTEIGITTTTLLYRDTPMRFWFLLANLRYYLQLTPLIKPYIGVGVIGMYASAYGASISEYLLDGFIGLELILGNYGLPFTIFAGVDYVTLPTEWFEAGHICYHIGARFDF